MATTILRQAESLSQVIYSNVEEIVEQQQYFFDTIWNNAIPAKRRIKEIEEGLKREFIDTIKDSNEIEKTISAAKVSYIGNIDSVLRSQRI